MKQKSSEITFGLIEQPEDICPHISYLLDSIVNLFDRDENDDVIFDTASIKDIESRIEALGEWGNSWLEFGEDIILPFIKESLEKFQYEEVMESITKENELENQIESLNEILPDFKDDLKRTETDLLFSFSGIVSNLESGDESSYKDIDDFRNEIKGYRETITHYKENIKEIAFEHFEDIPELSLLYKNHVDYMKKEQKKHIEQLKNKKNKKRITI